MQIRAYSVDNNYLQDVQANWFSSVTDPLELELLLDEVQLRYSQLMVLDAHVEITEAFWDEHPNEIVSGTTSITLGAILPTSLLQFYNKSAVLYYWVKRSDNLLSRRCLPYFAYYDMVEDGRLLPEWRDYFETYLDSFYTNSDYVLKDMYYNTLGFHHLNDRVFHRKAYRYPHTFMKWYL